MKKCELCADCNFELIATQIREGEGRIVQCLNCGLVAQDLQWNRNMFSEYYEAEYQKTNSLETGVIQSAREHFEDRCLTIGPLYEKVAPFMRSGCRVLDIGCGAGALLAQLKPDASRCVGVEAYSPFVEFMINELGIEAYYGDINELSLKGPFDLICCINTLDHLPNPRETLTTIRNLLAPSGTLYLEVPNRDEALNHYLVAPHESSYQTFFWHRAHMFYFTKQTIYALLESLGYEVQISCYHNYTLKNFLNWYFTGEPQKSFVEGCAGTAFFKGESSFETRMNLLFSSVEESFHTILSETSTGDTLACIARKMKSI